MKPSPTSAAAPEKPTKVGTAAQATAFREQATGVGQTLAGSRATGAARAAQVKTGKTPLTLPGERACSSALR